MIKRSQLFLKQLVLLIDASAIVAAFWAAHYLRRHWHTFYHLDLVPGRTVFKPLQPLETYLWLLLVILPIWIGMLHLLGAYREMRLKSYGRTIWLVLQACTLGLLLFGSAVFLLKLEYVSRSFMALFYLVSFGGLSLERAFLIRCFHDMLRHGRFQRNILIVGTGRRARAFIHTVRRHADWGLRIVGLLDEDAQMVGQRVADIAVIGSLDGLPRLLKDRVIDEVVFVVPRSWMTRIETPIRQCELAGIRATVAVDLFNLRFAQTHPTDLDGVPLITFDTTPIDQWQLAVKRLMDIVVSAVGLVVLLPCIPLIALLIKAASSGPVFFRQVRCGLNGRRFTLYKFRSMVLDAEAQLEDLQHLNELSGPVFKTTHDPRLTPIGRWLRKTSIDELPQLFNVFAGDMSLVGPRPPIPSEVEQYEDGQRRRLSMRPGITGYWQVNGRNRLKDFNEWLRLDLEYIDRWSLLLDMQILLKTIPTVLFGIGAK